MEETVLSKEKAALSKIASIDIEVNERDAIYSIGAVFAERQWCRKGHFNVDQALQELDSFVRDASFLLGHNLLSHDLPVLNQHAADLHLHKKLVIDTLFLSPLAFPENPYHRLVKNYKLLRDAVNDPVADARLAMQLFRDQCGAFQRGNADLLSFYAWCFSGNVLYAGLQQVFVHLGAKKLPAGQVADTWARLLNEKVCQTAMQRIASDVLPRAEKCDSLAYCVAWLQVAGGNSILPPWVHLQFPDVANILRQLRDVPCRAPACQWCRENHNAEKQLQDYFGYPAFREEPATIEGNSLQKAIVEHAMLGRPCLAILPTSGGKSLCFQLPALMRFYRRGVLTLVISPLQALMKDQVDNLRSKTGTTAVAALYGMLTPPERGAVLEGIRMGDIGILYISPEQLRNRSLSAALAYRELGCWVFDEAHCLSKWGHDFRPDYLYAGRFIREFSQKCKAEVPPVQCLTATAKNDVKQEITDYFQRSLGQRLTLYEGGVERDNLHFEVYSVAQANKYTSLQKLLQDRMAYNDDVCVVYCATRKRTEETADFLVQQGWSAEAFHARLDSGVKRDIQERFISGDIKIICATNAFGMGIDKENVRLVVHLDIPGSLENYLQEAGRAGRDRKEADCVLLYDENDIENQFRLGANSQLGRRDIAQLLRGLRVAANKTSDGKIVLTSGELLRSQFVDTAISAEDRDAQTKVFTAIAWLEKAELVQRNENRTTVFQAAPLVSSLQEARQKIQKLNLSARQQERWMAILGFIMSASSNDGFSADQLAELSPFAGSKDDPDKESESQRVIRTLHDMKEAGLLAQSVLLTAFVRHKVRDASYRMIKKMIGLEVKLLDKLQEQAPDADLVNSDESQWQNLSLRQLNQHLLNEGFDFSNSEILRSIVYGLTQDGKGMANQQGSLEMRHHGQDQYRILVKRGWYALRETARRRQAVAKVLLDTIIAKIPEDAPPNKNLLVEFSLDELSDAVRQDMVISSQLKDRLAAIDRALLYLHEQKIIILQNGLAVFRQAMTIQVQADKRLYTSGDYEPLSHHYGERVFQVHVMNEYARIGLEKIGAALEMVLAYFSLDKNNFVQRYFPRKKGMLERATSQQSYQHIVEELGNSKQQAIVSAPETRNGLILAGPGSGKTRTVVHRCAWLLRVKRVPATGILVLAFNRNAANLIRQRLRALVEKDAYGVTIQTYHSLALRLTGHSMEGLLQNDENIKARFDAAIKEAIALLKGDKELFGTEPDDVRDRLLAGYRHILVDEYQDIDALQYELISAIVGRTLDDKDSKLTLMAVGDDDQNIYQFRGANIGFIRRFQEDYEAETYYLTENYRSSKHIIDAANQLILVNQDRMKAKQPIVINKDRSNLPAGGEWQQRDLFAKGRVQFLQSPAFDLTQQAACIVAEMQRLKSLSPEWNWSEVAILAREWSTCDPLRNLCHRLDIPVCRYFSESPPLFRIREIHEFLDALKADRDAWLSPVQLKELLRSLQANKAQNLWWDLLETVRQEWLHEAGHMQQAVTRILDFYYESLMAYKQSRQFDTGLLLSTVHSAKGMEYEHVFICDGGWAKYKNQAQEEEARRLYYVAMTRARKTLTLCSNVQTPNPLIGSLEGDSVFKKSVQATADMMADASYGRVKMLSLKDIDLGYAGSFEQKHSIHTALLRLQSGDQLQMLDAAGQLFLLSGNIRVAKLSKKANASWKNHWQTIHFIEVIAVVQRGCADSGLEYQKRCKVDMWEVPLVEIRYAGGDEMG